jgi:glycosyltransferase involved in cell wall biosynthesis
MLAGQDTMIATPSRAGSRERIACLVMRSVMTRYPSSVFQAALLQDNGFRVVVCDIDDGGHNAVHLPDGVERHVLERVDSLYTLRRSGAPILKLLNRFKFQANLRLVLQRLSPDLVISYDPPALATVARLSGFRKPAFLHIWHCHEAAIVSSDMGWGTRRDMEMAKRVAQMVDCVIVPDRDRLENLFGDFVFSRPPLVVMNCPRLVENLPSASMSELFGATEGRRHGPTVVYLGSVGVGHGLEVAVKSMKLWPADSRFAVVGPFSEGYRRQLLDLASNCGNGGRVIVTGPVAAEMAWPTRVAADVLLTVMDVNQPLWRYCAGASNKRFEAMAAGVAQVTNEGPGIDGLFVRPGAAIAVKHDDIEATGSAVASLLADLDYRQRMRVRARALHLERYNYEAEFAPVLAKIMGMIGRR